MRPEIPRNVSIAIPQLRGGGAEKVTTRLATRLNAEGRLCRLYTGNFSGADRLCSLPLINLNARRALQAAVPFLQAVRSDPADSFLLTLGYINLAPLVRLRRPRARVVLRIGNTATPELRTLSPISRLRYVSSMRLAAHAADAIVVQCRQMGEDLARYIPGIENKLRVVYNFIEDELWRWRPPKAPPLAEPYIFCAASMKPQKGFDVLLAAYARSPRRRTARLVIAGVDPADASFTKLMGENDLRDSEVLRLGFMNEPYRWIAHAEICVLASRFEGFCNFLLESAALGKRIVATNCPGGNAEFFEHYDNVEVVSVDDVEALATAIDSPRRDLNRTEARRHLRPFDEDLLYSRYIKILMGEGGASAGAAAGAA